MDGTQIHHAEKDKPNSESKWLHFQEKPKIEINFKNKIKEMIGT